MFGCQATPASYARQLLCCAAVPPLQSLFPGRNQARSNVLPLAGKDLGGGCCLFPPVPLGGANLRSAAATHHNLWSKGLARRTRWLQSAVLCIIRADETGESEEPFSNRVSSPPFHKDNRVPISAPILPASRPKKPHYCLLWQDSAGPDQIGFSGVTK